MLDMKESMLGESARPALLSEYDSKRDSEVTVYSLGMRLYRCYRSTGEEVSDETRAGHTTCLFRHDS